ncbi:MAG: porin, partial [bacterium]
MNKKLIAVAVASTLAAPAVYADITPYGRINNAIDITDLKGEDNVVDVSNVSSRFGFKGSGDIGNGMTAIGRYEFSTTTDKELNNVNDLRLGYVGLSGGFGTITMGNQWSAYYNSVGTHLSPTYSIGYYLYSVVAQGPFRTSNTIKYANSFGPVSLELDIRVNDSEEDNDVAEKLNGNGGGIGLTFNATDDLAIALAFDNEENNSLVDADTGAVTTVDDTERTAIAGKWSFGGNYALILGYQKAEQGDDLEVEHTQLYFSAGLGEKTSLLVGFGTAEFDRTGIDNDAEPESIFLGVYHNMGGGLRLYL